MAGKMSSLEDLYIETLKDIYSAENQIIQALPKMEQAANSPDLKRGFREHLEQTKHQVERIEQIFANRESSPRGKKCMGMEGLLKEGEEVMQESGDPKVKDAGLIAAAQKVEHYEISAYGTARTFARRLGDQNAVRLLEQTLNEESATDKKLTAMAESHINAEAE